MRTKVVFTDLPYHYEYDIAIYQILSVGFLLEFSNLALRDMKNIRKTRVINGVYRVDSVKNIYKEGLVQYIELVPVKS